MIVSIHSKRGTSELHTLHVPDGVREVKGVFCWDVEPVSTGTTRRWKVMSKCVKDGKVMVNSVVRLVGKTSIWVLPPDAPGAIEGDNEPMIVDDKLVIVADAARAALSEDATALHSGSQVQVVELNFGDDVAFAFPGTQYNWISWHSNRYIEVDGVYNTRWKSLLQRVKKPQPLSQCTLDELSKTTWVSLGELALPLTAEGTSAL